MLGNVRVQGSDTMEEKCWTGEKFMSFPHSLSGSLGQAPLPGDTAAHRGRALNTHDTRGDSVHVCGEQE